VPDQKENLVKCNFRIEAGQVAFIEKLAKLKVLGSNDSAVVRSLLGRAIDSLVQGDFITKYLDQNERLDKLK